MTIFSPSHPSSHAQPEIWQSADSQDTDSESVNSNANHTEAPKKPSLSARIISGAASRLSAIARVPIYTIAMLIITTKVVLKLPFTLIITPTVLLLEKFGKHKQAGKIYPFSLMGVGKDLVTITKFGYRTFESIKASFIGPSNNFTTFKKANINVYKMALKGMHHDNYSRFKEYSTFSDFLNMTIKNINSTSC